MASSASVAAGTIIGRAIAPKVLDRIASALLTKTADVKSRYVNTFSAHIELTRVKCSKVRTIFTEDKEISLKSIYTNIFLESDNKKLRDDDVLDVIINKSINIVISGTGGAGKTMLMKYLALTAIEQNYERIPIFVELRNLPEHSPANFTKTVFEYISSEQTKHEYELFRHGLINGMFILFFDGLDEVRSDRRPQIFNSVNRFKKDFPKSRVIMSTRPDSDTRQWGSFEFFKTVGLSIEQVSYLIQKIPFNKQQKDAFLSVIDNSFYEKHESFLSVPLLCSLMLLTYREYQEVPTRMTVFYEQAFETLMRSHDRAKEGFYKRDHECGLSPDRFRSLFSAFCYRTLAFGLVSFTDDEIRLHISRSSKITEIDVDSEKYISDLASGVCVIIRDGLKLHFIHRSFQEYFAAIYLIRDKSSNTFDLYDRLIDAEAVNDVMSMAYDIDMKAFEREWALPMLEKLMNDVDLIEPEKRERFVIEALYDEFGAGQGDEPHLIPWHGSKKKLYRICMQLTHVYGTDYPELYPQFIFVGRTGSSWLDYKRPGVKFPEQLEKSIHKFKRHEDGIILLAASIKSSEFSDDFYKTVGLFDDARNLLKSLTKLHTDISQRVEKREVIDILS